MLNKKDFPICFFGTSDFAVPVLRALVKDNWLVASVVTQPDKPAKRGMKMEASPVKKAAQELNLKIIQPDNLRSPEIFEELNNLKAKVGILVSYSKIIPQSVISMFPYGILNVHPSLLPKYRGPSPIQAAILNDEKETGVSIMLLDAEMDHGDIVENAECRMQNAELEYGKLLEILAKKGTELLLKVLPEWLENKITPQEQDHDAATYTKIIKKEDGKINWQKPAEEIERQIMAYNPWPGTWTMWQGKRLKILQGRAIKLPFETVSLPGSVVGLKNGPICVVCAQNGLELIQIQLEGKKPVLARDFVQGHKGFIGMRFIDK